MERQKFSELIAGNKPVLVDFSAEWCGPCKMMAPVLKQVKDLVGDEATIIKVDVDSNSALAAANNISGVPTLILFRNGAALWRQSGVVSAVHLKNVIDKYKV